MNPKSEIHDWIDRYLNDEMNELERHEFETKLLSDESLAKTLEAQKVANKIVIGEELLQLKKQMSQDLNGGGKYPGGAGGKTLWYYISGALVVTGALVYFLIQKNTTVTIDSAPNDQTTKEHGLFQDTINNSLDNNNSNEKNNATKKQIISVDKNQTTSTPEKLSSCKDSIINFSCQARGSCIQKKDGAIEIDIKTIKSGDAPYRFSLFPSTEFKETSVLSDLKPGKYKLYVKDSKQCLRKLNVEVEVPVINCPK